MSGETLKRAREIRREIEMLVHLPGDWKKEELVHLGALHAELDELLRPPAGYAAYRDTPFCDEATDSGHSSANGLG